MKQKAIDEKFGHWTLSIIKENRIKSALPDLLRLVFFFFGFFFGGGGRNFGSIGNCFSEAKKIINIHQMDTL